jgi:hypothetical protein
VNRLFALFLAASTALHLFLALRFPLAPDETYYWEWSRNLQPGYYDQGPMIAWWIRAGCLLFGETAPGVRIGIAAAALATQALLYLLGRDLFGPRAALVGLVLTSITPLALAGSFVATYDPLLVLFWTAALYFTARALFFGSRRAWIGLGLSFGMGLLSKHTMALFAPCLLIFLATQPEQRRWLRRREPYLALLLALIVFAPNLWWQAQNDWMTFGHLFLLTGKGTDRGFLRRLGDFVGSQVALITPLLFFGFVAALIRAAQQRRQPDGERRWFLFCLSAPVLLLFLLMTARSKVQANWAIAGWLAPGLLYAAYLVPSRGGEMKRGGEEETLPPVTPPLHHSRARHASPLHSTTPSPDAQRLYAGLAALACALLSLLLIWPELRPALRLRFPPQWDQMNKMYGGAELGAAADRERRAMEAQSGRPIVIGAATYDNASRMAFYMSGQPRAYCFFLGTRLNSYVQWNRRAGLRPGSDALIVDDRPPDDPLLPPFHAIFERVEPVAEPIPVYRRPLYSELIHTYYLYRCFGYRPNPAVERPRGG